MKTIPATNAIPSKVAEERPVITISVRRAAIIAATLTCNRTEHTEIAGAVLAGLALSQTLFHARVPRINGLTAHAKLRV